MTSSSLSLGSTLPPIDRVMASSQGAMFEIEDVTSSEVLTWSSRTRNVTETVAPSNIVRLIPSAGGAPYEGFVGPTLGFYVDMPVKFEGATADSGLENFVTYYVGSIENDTDITLIDDLVLRNTVVLNDCVISIAGLLCFVGQTVDRTFITIDYPGIAIVTATKKGTNEITVPMTAGGNAGTNGYYTGLPIFFVGTVFGNIIENDPYYVTSVVDKQTITVSKNENPIILTVTASQDATTPLPDPAPGILICYSTLQLSVNDPVIFSNITVDGNSTDDFGGITSEVIYYISAVYAGSGNTTFSVSAIINGESIKLTAVTGPRFCTMTNQKDTLPLTTASGTMTINAGLPISPGQVNGQVLTFYPTSGQLLDQYGIVGDLLTRIVAAVADDRLSVMASSGGLSNMYVNMPLRFANDYYFPTILAGTTYYVLEMGTVTTQISETVALTGELICDVLNGFYTTGFYVGMPITFGTSSLGDVSLNVKYYIWTVVDSARFTISSAAHRDEQLVLTSNIGLMTAVGETYITLRDGVGNPISIPSDPNIPVSVTFTQHPDPLNLARFNISYRRGGYSSVVINPGYADPFDPTYVPGYTINNTITIPGNNFPGGATPENDLIMTIDSVGFSTTALTASSVTNAITCLDTEGLTINDPVVFTGTPFSNIEVGIIYYVESIVDGVSFTLAEYLYGPVFTLITAVGSMTVTDSKKGNISRVIVSGVPNETVSQYYVKVISASVCEIFSDPLLTIPVNINTFNFNGITSIDAIETKLATSTIVVSDVTAFSIGDPVIFTGDVFGGNDMVLGDTYYITAIDLFNNELSISTQPADTLGGTTVPLSNATGSMIMAKTGDFALLPNPFYFDQSVVKYNNRMYQCIISNNDTEFVFGKWELLDTGDYRLNALDRIFGYYQPTVNMPGNDFSQLLTGVTYPNSTYLGNAFAPDDEFSVDVLLQDQHFYPSEVDVTAVVWDGTQYLMSANTPQYSAVIYGVSGVEWTIDKISN